MTGQYPLEISHNEAMVLSDRLPFTQDGPEDTRPLLLKIGSALLDTANEQRAVTVYFSRDQLWHIRNSVNSQIAVGSEPVGLNLLTKVYTAMRHVAADQALEEAELGLRADGNDRTRDDKRFSRWQDRRRKKSRG